MANALSHALKQTPTHAVHGHYVTSVISNLVVFNVMYGQCKRDTLEVVLYTILHVYRFAVGL